MGVGANIRKWGEFVRFSHTLFALPFALAAMVVAVRQALDYESTGRALAVCLIGFVLNLAALVVVGRLLGAPVVLAP